MSQRSTIYNIFRIPLNAIVLAVLLYKMEMTTAFSWCVAFLATAGVCQILLLNTLSKKAKEATYALVRQPSEPERSPLTSASEFEAEVKDTVRHSWDDEDKEGKGPDWI